MSFRHVGIVGAGSWGTALAVLLQENRLPVTIWGHDAAHIASIAATRTRTRPIFPESGCPESLRLTTEVGRPRCV